LNKVLVTKYPVLSREKNKLNLKDNNYIQPVKYMIPEENTEKIENNYRIEKAFTYKNLGLDSATDLDPSYTMDPPERPFSKVNSIYLEEIPGEITDRSSYRNNPLEESEGCVEMGESRDYMMRHEMVSQMKFIKS